MTTVRFALLAAIVGLGSSLSCGVDTNTPLPPGGGAGGPPPMGGAPGGPPPPVPGAAGAPGGQQQPPPPPPASGDIQQVCVDAINMYRATLNLPPYARFPEKEPCADDQAKSDSASGTAHGAFGKCGESAQDECPGWAGDPKDQLLKCLKQMWDEGPPGSGPGQHGHYVNMSNPKYRQAFCGFYKTSAGKWWMIQNFK